MAGRHRAPRPPRSLKIPGAIAGTVTAMGLAAAVSFATASNGTETSGEQAQVAAHPSPGAAPSSSAATAAKSAVPKAKRATSGDDRRTARSKPTVTSSKAVATATVRAPKKTAPPKKPAEPCPTVLAGTQPPVAQVGNHIKEKCGVSDIGGRAARANASGHPSGLALDFMVDPATGDKLADYVLDNQEDFGVTYVIWQHRYNDGSGWSMMEDRGSPTANHMDHVHVSFSGEDIDVTC